jgi:hypothetical protein
MHHKDRRGTVVPSPQLRNSRVPVKFALEVEGTNSAGRPFRVQALAVTISRNGATIALETDVAIGSVVRLTPPFGRTLDAEVNGAWTDQMNGQRRIGVKLLDADGWFAK